MRMLTIISLCICAMLNANTLQAIEVNIEVTDIEVARGGSLSVMIFGKAGFPKVHKKALLIQKSSELQETMNFVFNLDTKEFAIKVWHDEDNNEKVTKNWSGVYPSEGLGFSNGQKVSFTGAPGYKKSKLQTSQLSSKLHIPVLYP